jgi:hypothetical protein
MISISSHQNPLNGNIRIASWDRSIGVRRKVRVFFLDPQIFPTPSPYVVNLSISIDFLHFPLLIPPLDRFARWRRTPLLLAFGILM